MMQDRVVVEPVGFGREIDSEASRIKVTTPIWRTRRQLAKADLVAKAVFAVNPIGQQHRGMCEWASERDEIRHQPARWSPAVRWLGGCLCARRFRTSLHVVPKPALFQRATARNTLGDGAPDACLGAPEIFLIGL